MSEEQWTLKDVTPAWFGFSCDEHQVTVDKHCDLKKTEILRLQAGTGSSEENNEGQWVVKW